MIPNTTDRDFVLVLYKGGVIDKPTAVALANYLGLEVTG